jgi:hypothetical protein
MRQSEESFSLSQTFAADPEQLQPMIGNRITTTVCDRREQVRQIVSGEEKGAAATRANDEMFMTLGRAQIAVTPPWQMDPLDETQLLQFFESTVYGHQAQRWVFRAPQIEKLSCAQSLAGACHDLNKLAAWSSQPVTVRAQPVQPMIEERRIVGHIIEMDFHYHYIGFA